MSDKGQSSSALPIPGSRGRQILGYDFTMLGFGIALIILLLIAIASYRSIGSLRDRAPTS
jgi:hypothetical protein